jgi:hypothetical protein
LDAGQESGPAQLYGRIEMPETAALLTEIVSVAETKRAGSRQLEGAIGVLEQMRHRQDNEAHKEHLTDEDTDALRQIHGYLERRKGNLRIGGLQ